MHCPGEDPSSPSSTFNIAISSLSSLAFFSMKSIIFLINNVMTNPTQDNDDDDSMMVDVQPVQYNNNNNNNNDNNKMTSNSFPRRHSRRLLLSLGLLTVLVGFSFRQGNLFFFCLSAFSTKCAGRTNVSNHGLEELGVSWSGPTVTVGTNTSSNSSNNKILRGEKTVYSCGYSFDLHRVFQPEYQVGTFKYLSPPAVTNETSLPHHRNRRQRQRQRHRPDDILIYGMYGPCPAFGISENADPALAVDRLLSAFPGKVLVVNGEPILFVGEEHKGDVFGGLRRWSRGIIGSSSDNQRVNCSIDGASGNDKESNNHCDINCTDTTLKKFRSRLFQLGPYPPLERHPISSIGNSRNGKGNEDCDYVSMYESHSLQVFHMALYMTRQFGPPPPEATLLSSPSFPASSNLSMDAYKVAPKRSSTTAGRKTYSEVWDWWTDPAKRRNNTGRYAAIAYFARNCVPHRQAAATRLSSVLPVHSAAGGCKVLSQTPNRTFAMPAVPPREAFRTNHVTYHDYKYCLVMENTAQDGYMTEKIANAFLGGCMPIYYGTRQVYDVFHEDSFVFYDIQHPQRAVDLIQQLEADPVEYHRRLQETPILKEGSRSMHLYFSLVRGTDIDGWVGLTKTTNNSTMITPVATLTERIRNMMGV